MKLIRKLISVLIISTYCISPSYASSKTQSPFMVFYFLDKKCQVYFPDYAGIDGLKWDGDFNYDYANRGPNSMVAYIAGNGTVTYHGNTLVAKNNTVTINGKEFNDGCSVVVNKDKSLIPGAFIRDGFE